MLSCSIRDELKKKALLVCHSVDSHKINFPFCLTKEKKSLYMHWEQYVRFSFRFKHKNHVGRDLSLVEPEDIGSKIAPLKKAYTRGANHTIRHRDSLILGQGVQCQEAMRTQTSLILHYEGATKNDPLGRKLEPFQDEKRIVVRTCFNLLQHLFAKGKMCTGFVLCCGNNSDHKCLWLPIMPNHNLVPAKLFSSRCSWFSMLLL